MNGLGLQEDAEDGCGTGERCLQPKDIAPTAKRDDDAADEGAKRWPNQCTR